MKEGPCGAATGNGKPKTSKTLSRKSRAFLRNAWPEYVREVRKRLKRGAETYGDESFKRPVSELLEEIESELMDVSGWAFVLWCRIRELKKKQENP